MDFPASPTLNQLYTFNGVTWKCVSVGPPPEWEIDCLGGPPPVIDSGTALITNSGTINFAAPISSPRVVVTAQSGGNVLIAFLTSVSSTGFTVSIWDLTISAPGSGTIHWHAV